MRLLIDTNILLDVLMAREEHYMPSYAVWKTCEKGYADGYISSLTFANIVYIMRKQLHYDEIDVLLRNMKNAFHFADLTLSELEGAAKMKWRDFEDAVFSLRRPQGFTLTILLRATQKILTGTESEQ